jgi:hypothetical protein
VDKKTIYQSYLCQIDPNACVQNKKQNNLLAQKQKSNLKENHVNLGFQDDVNKKVLLEQQHMPDFEIIKQNKVNYQLGHHANDYASSYNKFEANQNRQTQEEKLINKQIIKSTIPPF